VLDGSSIFRIVNLQNQPATVPAKIEVIQMGLREMNTTISPTIEHEPTGRTGLRHLKGTISLARFAPGAVYHSFFVCMRDEPSLDQGGARNPDGMGFAAFCFVAIGFGHLREVFAAHAAANLPEYLDARFACRHSGGCDRELYLRLRGAATILESAPGMRRQSHRLVALQP